MDYPTDQVYSTQALLAIKETQVVRITELGLFDVGWETLATIPGVKIDALQSTKGLHINLKESS